MQRGLFTSCGQRELLSSCRAWDSHRRGLPCCGAQGLGHTGFSSCSTQAELLLGMWDLPGSGIEPIPPVLACGFFTTELPGKPSYSFFMQFHNKRAEGCILVHGVNWRGGRFPFVSILSVDGLSLLLLGNVEM